MVSVCVEGSSMWASARPRATPDWKLDRKEYTSSGEVRAGSAAGSGVGTVARVPKAASGRWAPGTRRAKPAGVVGSPTGPVASGASLPAFRACLAATLYIELPTGRVTARPPNPRAAGALPVLGMGAATSGVVSGSRCGSGSGSQVVVGSHVSETGEVSADAIAWSGASVVGPEANVGSGARLTGAALSA